MTKSPYVYIMASGKNGTLYIGVTSNLLQRIHQHKTEAIEGFSKKYNTKTLVYFEEHQSMDAAIIKEKQLKDWKRLWKIRIIEETNPDWNDLFEQINQ